MLSRVEILTMLVGLKEVNDLDLIKGNSVLSVSCAEPDKPTVRAMASIIEELYDRFDYEASPEFLAKIDGKPEQVQTMHRKLLDAEKRGNAVKRLGESITAILDSDEVYNLVAIEQHHRLDELKKLAESLTAH